ncbi:hydroxymethylglutaryl-CoA reductase, degradative [Winogradskyella immobilis]|uniref:3-hydroxy-3-methylglutaryl coenzyme A reductase n=1 Tax=Winogradskyella immobilis TaxID=2816852 RepID=A0ABS8EJ03_9FLAO|nr:hydroxymethylglutaryl-CoA reductase, degradative [Winogradskyella immobilis]MCC1483181.1 hydroxymethylglutaryl-CoA reductase, degradative [Winogradskyella immobilis]MCG0015276.1 hydroxymethylglutaryl-CoA reductase, degradative [Winogradskyella immobilis]
MQNTISGFSKLKKAEKIDWLLSTYFSDNVNSRTTITQYWNTDEKLQKLHDEFIENTISNFYLPLGVAPNFLINDQVYTIPMAIEESSVVAAASKSAKFWFDRGGFKAKVLSTTKIGQVHFTYHGDTERLRRFFNIIKPKLINETSHITKNMERRGGGILDIELKDKTNELDNYYQLHVTFETLDAMGANFINSCLEQFAKTLTNEAQEFKTFTSVEKDIHIVMSILSNYVPDCIVRAEVSCKIEDLKDKDIPNPKAFVEKFKQAVSIAEVEPHRAVTHNKGIMNGIDAVVLATGNDFRAVEAGVHAYASKSGRYSSLTHCKLTEDTFTFSMEIPLALGTIGGLTTLHPLVKFALQLLGNPSAKDLMKIVAVAGLAQNFAALKSLTTTGIQKGHMKMHLMNILNQFEATNAEKDAIVNHFKTNTVTHSAVVEAIKALRNH